MDSSTGRENGPRGHELGWGRVSRRQNLQRTCLGQGEVGFLNVSVGASG